MSNVTTGQAWVIEYRGAIPVPVYLTEKGTITTEILRAIPFATQEQAQAWMAAPMFPRAIEPAKPFTEPWFVVEHVIAIGQ